MTVELAGHLVQAYPIEIDLPCGQVAGRRLSSQLFISASISGWESLSPIFTAEWQAMVARIWSSRRWPGSVPEMAERASLNAPAISLSASVEITAVTLTDLGPNGSASAGERSTTSGTRRLCTVAGLSESLSLSRMARSWATCWSTTQRDSGSSMRM